MQDKKLSKHQRQGNILIRGLSPEAMQFIIRKATADQRSISAVMRIMIDKEMKSHGK